MAVDEATVKRIARLARLAVTDEEVTALRAELNSILNWVEQLKEVKTDDIEPMTSVTPRIMDLRKDSINDGGYPEEIVANAPIKEDTFFVVPKVVE